MPNASALTTPKRHTEAHTTVPIASLIIRAGLTVHPGHVRISHCYHQPQELRLAPASIPDGDSVMGSEIYALKLARIPSWRLQSEHLSTQNNVARNGYRGLTA